MSDEAQEIAEDQVLKKLRAFITYDYRIKDLAARFKVSNAFMSAVLSGKKKMTEEMLRAVGVRCITVYVIDEKVALKAA